MLEYGLVNQAGFSVITGAIGSGKTTLVRKLLHQIEDDVTVGLVSNTQCSSFEELLRWILLSFELEYRVKDKVELYHTFTDFLINEYTANRRVVLIVDEAQHLSSESLEQLRMLSNINADKHQMLQLILVGQPDLRDLLRHPELEQFVQRIAIDYHLEPLDVEETKSYIRHRIMVAGGDPYLFTDDTYAIIWSRTGGVPRLINLLCDAVLVYGFAEQKPDIDIEVVEDVVRDKRMGLSPIRGEERTLYHQDAARIASSSSLQGQTGHGGFEQPPARPPKPQGRAMPSSGVEPRSSIRRENDKKESKPRKLSTIEKLYMK